MRAWLFRILRNLHVSAMRNRGVRRHQTIEDTPEEGLQVPAFQLAAIEQRELRQALKALKMTQREALILVVVAECSYNEAAAICGCAVGTIKSRVSRAKSALLYAMSKPDAAAKKPCASIDDEMRVSAG
jgi:RNA polymerase sigma-70 factor (ECF subfamily)